MLSCFYIYGNFPPFFCVYKKLSSTHIDSSQTAKVTSGEKYDVSYFDSHKLLPLFLLMFCQHVAQMSMDSGFSPKERGVITEIQVNFLCML